MASYMNKILVEGVLNRLEDLVHLLFDTGQSISLSSMVNAWDFDTMDSIGVNARTALDADLMWPKPLKDFFVKKWCAIRDYTRCRILKPNEILFEIPTYNNPIDTEWYTLSLVFPQLAFVHHFIDDRYTHEAVLRFHNGEYIEGIDIDKDTNVYFDDEGRIAANYNFFSPSENGRGLRMMIQKKSSTGAWNDVFPL